MGSNCSPATVSSSIKSRKQIKVRVVSKCRNDRNISNSDSDKSVPAISADNLSKSSKGRIRINSEISTASLIILYSK